VNLKQLVEPITDEDVNWVIELMGLKSLDEPRRQFLKSMETLDVSACPGSGKTTLVVAKLAILARHWKSRTQGICVLSHTNAAREEIERRLGNTDIGQRLLRYPHFIDTIHGFVVRFLASPWLRSKGYPLVAIDDEATHRARRNALTKWEYGGLQMAYTAKHLKLENLRIHSIDFDHPLAGRTFEFAAHTDTYKRAAKALSHAAKGGYFCFDEVFVLGNALLDAEPVAAALQLRFPCVLVDEMQDTQSAQGDILCRVFPRNLSSLCVIRVGDPNQEIFEKDEAMADPFPEAVRSLEIASSFRFPQAIASIANPFAYVPVSGGLKGLREPDADKMIPNTIIVFPDDDASQVLVTYGKLLLEHLPAAVRRGGAYALGAVHRLENFKEGQFPKSVEHYWDQYQSAAGKPSFRPRTFAEGIHIAQHHVARDPTASSGVELLASCMWALAGLAFPHEKVNPRSRRHNLIEQTLMGSQETLGFYRACVHRLLLDPRPFTEQEWNDSIAHVVLNIASALHNQPPSTAAVEAYEYLKWAPPILLDANPGEASGSMINTYRFQGESDSVDIRLASIHAEKGKTHAATLVLETFNRTHFVERLLPWLEGKPSAAKLKQATIKKNMMLMYVAMTRPSHMLCLAMRRSTLGEGATGETRRQILTSAGWSFLEL